QGIDVPGLQIAAGCRSRRALNQIADDVQIDRLVEKPAAGLARVDRFKDVHGGSLSFMLPASLISRRAPPALRRKRAKASSSYARRYLACVITLSVTGVPERTASRLRSSAGNRSAAFVTFSPRPPQVSTTFS